MDIKPTRPFDRAMIDLRYSDAELTLVRDRIVTFIADTVADAGATGAILGLSGGIDSSLTAYLTVEAIGRENLLGLILPGAVSSDASVSDAIAVVDDLDLHSETIDIEPIVDTVIDAAPPIDDEQLAVGNTRARARAVLSYYLANAENHVVIGTGNRTEAAIGYFTKYGDGAVDCHPIGNLYKSQVRQLARHVGVPESIIEKPPSAELWADQTDEDEIGIDYDTLDAVVALHIDGPLSADATCRFLNCDRAVVDRVQELYRQSAHKRALPPVP